MGYRGLMFFFINGANRFKIVNYTTRFLDKFGNDKLLREFPAKRIKVTIKWNGTLFHCLQLKQDLELQWNLSVMETQGTEIFSPLQEGSLEYRWLKYVSIIRTAIFFPLKKVFCYAPMFRLRQVSFYLNGPVASLVLVSTAQQIWSSAAPYL